MPANTAPIPFSIYVLRDPISNDIRYVGLSSNPYKRFKTHIYRRNTPGHKNNWISSLEKQELLPILEVLENNLTFEEACLKEIEYISTLKKEGFDLTNMTAGGDAPMVGKTHSQFFRLKMKNRMAGEKNPFYGKNHSKETCNKISNSLKGRGSWSKGKRFSEEHRKKLSLAKKGKSPPNKGRRSFSRDQMVLLKNQGKTQKEISILLGCDQSVVSRYLNNVNRSLYAKA